MPDIQQVLKIMLDPYNPVPEICGVINAVRPYHPAAQEEAILRGVQEAIEARLKVIAKGGPTDGKQVL